MSLIILTKDSIIAARDQYGRLPIVVGKRWDGFCLSTESFAFQKLGYETYKELQAGEIVRITADGVEVMAEGDPSKMKICTFLWTYYGYPTASYSGRNVEEVRYLCGQALARRDKHMDVDGVSGVPDSGVAHALGYSQEAGIRYARPFVKYTPTWPRSFMPPDQKQRDLIAHMKLIPIPGLIRDKRLVFCDDSIVRGTQLRQQAKRLWDDGAKAIHMRIACPPLLYGCKFINFSRSKSVYDLATRRYIRDAEGDDPAAVDKYQDPDGAPYKAMVEKIRGDLGLTSLAFQRLDDLVAAIGLPKEKLCTYCWTGKDVSDKKCTGCANCPHKEK
jgi:amidophosphoribosyltransferase